jgi:hypothetical protein
VVAVEALAIWLFIDAGMWVSGHKRYMIFFERVFDTPESAASRMRWIQGIVAVVFGCVCITGLLSLHRRASRGSTTDEKDVV